VSDRESGLTSKPAFRSPSNGGKNGRLMNPRPRRTTCCPNVRIATRQQYFQLRTIFWPTECLIDRALYLPRAVLRGENIRTRPRSPLLCPLCRGIGVCFGVRSRPQHGTGDFRRSSRGPRRMEGCGGNAPGPSRADRFRESASATRATKQRCRSVVGRLLDTFDKDAGGVSTRQHSAMFICGGFSAYGTRDRGLPST
jgi:hypothetical protein